MKHVFQYEGKKALIDGYGKKELIDPGVYTWFGAPADAMLPLYIRAVRADKWYYNACSIRKNSHEFSIEFPRTGTFSYTQNDKNYTLKPGGIFFVRKQVDNYIRCESNYAEKFAVLLSGILLDSILKTLRLDQTDAIPLLNPEPVLRSFETLFELSKNMEQENFRAANAECYKLLLELSAQTGILTQPPDLREALQYINQNLTRNLKLSELCHYTGYSSATLTRKFQRSFNKSPMEFYLEKKLEKAKDLLTQHTYSVKEVAALLNYSSPQYFSAQFAHYFGVPPSDVLKKKI